MDKMKTYQEIIKRILLDYASIKSSIGEIETETIFDDAKGHYQILDVGWQGKYRVHGTSIHIDIIGDKLWIQYNGTDRNIADELVEAGIPRDAIVLGFHPPELRQYTGFAVT